MAIWYIPRKTIRPGSMNIIPGTATTSWGAPIRRATTRPSAPTTVAPRIGVMRSPRPTISPA